MLVAISLSFSPCWAAGDDKDEEKKSNKGSLWDIAALVSIVFVGGGVAFVLPSLLKKRELLKKVGDYGDVRVKGLHHHFTTEQTDTILKWRAAGDSYRGNTIGLQEVLVEAARHGDQDILERVIELATEHNVTSFINPSLLVDMWDAAAEHQHIDIAKRVLELAAKQDVELVPWDIVSMFEFAAEQQNIDIAKQVLELAAKQDVKFVSWDIESMFKFAVEQQDIDIVKQMLELAAKQDNIDLFLEPVFKFAVEHQDVDIARQVLELAAKQDVKFSFWDIESMFKLAVEHQHTDIAKQVLKLADKKAVEFSFWDIEYMFELAVEHQDVDIAKQLLELAAKQDVKFESFSIVSMFKFAVKRQHTDIAKQVLDLAAKQDGSLFFPWDMVSMFKFAVEHQDIDTAKQLLELADEKDIEFVGWHILSMLQNAAKLGDDDVQQLVAKLAKKNGIDPDDVYGRTRPSPTADYAGDPYEVLGVSDTASSKDIKAAFRQLARKYHPDKLDKDLDEKAKAAAVKKFREVMSAYEELGRRGKID